MSQGITNVEGTPASVKWNQLCLCWCLVEGFNTSWRSVAGNNDMLARRATSQGLSTFFWDTCFFLGGPWESQNNFRSNFFSREAEVLRRFRAKVSEKFTLYFESILLYLESVLLYFESVLLYFESNILYFEGLFLYFQSALLDVERILVVLCKYTFVLCHNAWAKTRW